MLNGNIGVIKSMIAGTNCFLPSSLSRLTQGYYRFDRCIEHRTRLRHDASHVVCGRYHWVRHLSVAVTRECTCSMTARRPLIGGQLARPHDRWPDVFTNPFWQYYPYFLPCAASALFSAVIFTISAAFLREVCGVLTSPGPGLLTLFT